MAATLDDLVRKFKGFKLMMQQSLDKISRLEAWQSTADTSLGALLTKSEEAASRLQRLETAPPPPTRLRPPPPPAWINPFDLNMAPPQPRSPALAPERPSGHRIDLGHRDAGHARSRVRALTIPRFNLSHNLRIASLGHGKLLCPNLNFPGLTVKILDYGVTGVRCISRYMP